MSFTLTYRHSSTFHQFKCLIDKNTTLNQLRNVYRSNFIDPWDKWFIIKINNFDLPQNTWIMQAHILYLRDLELPPKVTEWLAVALSTGEFKYVCTCSSLSEIEVLRSFRIYGDTKIISVHFENKYYAIASLTYKNWQSDIGLDN